VQPKGKVRAEPGTRDAGVQTDAREALQRMFRENYARLHAFPATADKQAVIGRCFDESGSSDIGLRDAQLFGYRGAPQLLQCARCDDVYHHACLEATGAELEARVLRPGDRGEVRCLVCFRECGNGLERVGHMLTHAPDELRMVGLNEQLVLRYVAEKFPRGQLVTPCRWKKERTSFRPLCELLPLNTAPDDGLTGLLLKRLFSGATEIVSLCEDPKDRLWRGLSEPCMWVVGFDPTKEQGDQFRVAHAAPRKRKSFSPVALVGDGTFAPGLSMLERLHFEVAVMLALVAAGEWKRQEAGARPGAELAYVGWHQVRRQLARDGRGELGELFAAFFARRVYSEEALKELFRRVDSSDWGFTREVVWRAESEEEQWCIADETSLGADGSAESAVHLRV
jgi:hypothetical protein